MEKYINVMKHASELQVTVYEGLQHMQTLLNDGKFEDTIPLFNNIVEAFSVVENSVVTLPKEVFSNETQSLTTKVKDALNLVVSSFELKNFGKIQEILQFTLIPSYKKWMEELDEMFQPYLVS
ncbi:hypothetical protein [Virgibacillus ndiopensis]|uniref:hypothetical protein n=1 Tax=Virgibacillus ndiopensis TaxID=2004408 RepID=UPI000C086840|nr:hypothetical protein [Virgibacillus ndiopensis]